jgi:hypothetical protein
MRSSSYRRYSNMDRSVTLLPGGLIGHRVVTVVTGVPVPAEGKEPPPPKTEYVEGAILALRENGDQALFACSAEDSKVPAEWIPISGFVVNPIAIATEEDFYEDEPLPGEVEVEPEGRGPMDPKKPSLRVLRRGEP